MLKEIIVPNTSRRSYVGGAYCHMFVVANNGEYVLKGFFRECTTYLAKQELLGVQYFARVVTFKYNTTFTIYLCSGNVSLDKPGDYVPIYIDKKWYKTRIWKYRFSIKNSNKVLIFKRIPNKWNDKLTQFFTN